MKKRYVFSTGDSVMADTNDLRQLLSENQQYLDNYLEVFDCLEDDAYVARGNGFCDRKYSEDFIESQMAKYQQRISEIKAWLEEGV